jgi:hypothetical protein
MAKNLALTEKILNQDLVIQELKLKVTSSDSAISDEVQLQS